MNNAIKMSGLFWIDVILLIQFPQNDEVGRSVAIGTTDLFCGPYYLGYVPRFLFAQLTFAFIEYNFLGFWSTGQTTGN